MPINAIKDRRGRQRFQFEFDRWIGGERARKRKLLPAGWTRAQADAFDRQVRLLPFRFVGSQV